MRSFVFGLLAGFLLSAMRAPLGLDITQVLGVEAAGAALFRASALFALALALDPARKAFRKGVPIPLVLFACTLGYSLHGLFVASAWAPEGRLGFVGLLLFGTLGLVLAAGPRGRAQGSSGEAVEGLGPVGLREKLGLVLVGMGTTMALENTARHLRLVHLGLPEDDTVVGISFLALTSLGAVAFGRLFSTPKHHRSLLAAGLVLAGTCTLFGLSFLGGLGPDPLYAFLQRFGLDTTQIGMLESTAVLAARTWVVTGFLCGAALCGATNARRLGSLLGGAGVALLFLPRVVHSLSKPLTFEQLSEEPWAWKLTALGVVLATFGSLASLVGGRRAASRRGGQLITVAACLFALFGQRPSVWVFSPWHRAVTRPILSVQTPEGLLTVESDRQRAPTVHLDRRRLSPTGAEQEVDELRFAQAWSLLSEEKRRTRSARVLFIGQLTPPRARVFQRLGYASLDRTAPWHRSLPDVERVLFGETPVPGEGITTAEARRRIRSRNYDLVVVAPIHGPQLFNKSATIDAWASPEEPATANLRVPETTVAVVWVDATAPLVRRDLPDHVILATDKTQYLSVGLILGEEIPAPPQGPNLIPTGTPKPRASAYSQLRSRPYPDRHRKEQHRLLVRLTEAAVGTPVEPLARGVELHLAAQEHSSPWESLAQQIELDEDSLRAFFEAASKGHLDLFLRRAWEGFAWLLTEKRRIDLILVYVEPLADAYAPWPELDLAVAHAYQEFDMPEEAARALERAAKESPLDIRLLKETAQWLARAGRFEEAERSIRQALAVQSGRVDLERELGKILMMAGDARGRALLEELLSKHPEDDETLRLLQEGPSLPQGYKPDSHFHDH